jgi:hypothetical protein
LKLCALFPSGTEKKRIKRLLRKKEQQRLSKKNKKIYTYEFWPEKED